MAPACERSAGVAISGWLRNLAVPALLALLLGAACTSIPTKLDSPVVTLETVRILSVADARANPTKISFGTSGPATSPAIALTQLNSLGKTEIVGVPYRGSGEAARNVAAGGIDGAFAFYSQAKPLADDGKIRALAVASAQRIATWADVPTMDELGFPNFDYSGFVGLAAPAKTPPAIVAFLNKELNAVVQSQPFRERMEALGMTVPADNTPEKLADLLRRETVRQAALAKLSGHAPLAPQR